MTINNRLAGVIELFKKDKITVSRAAEISGVDYETMKSIRKEEGILRRARKGEGKDTGELEEMVI